MKNPFLTGLIIGLILSCLLFFKLLCNSPVTVRDYHVEDSLKKQIAIRESKIAADSINYESERRADDSDRNAWLETKDFIEKRMSNKIAELTLSVNKYRTAALAKDTAEQLIDCNQIVEELDSVYLQALGYKKVIDSLQQNATGRRGIDSSEINLLRQQIVGDGQAMQSMVDKIAELIKENEDLRKLISKNKRAKWLLMGISAILGGFLVHEAK